MYVWLHNAHMCLRLSLVGESYSWNKNVLVDLNNIWVTNLDLNCVWIEWGDGEKDILDR
jgi:hypothetical protein